MIERYQRQVSLLLDVLPIIAKDNEFALKGGTAINFFVLDCPRLSVDIDLHYQPLNDWETARENIYEKLEVIKSEIEKSLQDTKVRINNNSNERKVFIEQLGAKVVIEPNYKIRGCLLPTVTRRLCSSLEEDFDRTVTIECVATEELYAGKLCAALHRQHPRDLFDILLLLEENPSLSADIIDVFLVYLISQSKQLHETLNPNIHDITEIFRNQFTGMTTKEVELKQLAELQINLSKFVLSSLTNRHRQFLIGFKQGKPDWNLLPFPHASKLPAVLWKQLNLENMNKVKRSQALQKLVQLLNDNPYEEIDRRGGIMSDQANNQEPQTQLAEEILNELIGKKLIDKARRTEVLQQISTGTLKSEDWSLLVDIAAEQTDQAGKGCSHD